MSVLYQKALLLSATEDTAFRTDEINVIGIGPAKTSNAMLVVDPQFSADVTVLSRNNVKTHLSPDASVVARKIAQLTFQHEVRHNGNTDGLTPSRVGILLRGCGMQELQVNTADTNNRNTVGYGANFDRMIPLVVDTATPANATVTEAGTYSGTRPRVVVVECDGAGTEGTSTWLGWHREQGTNTTTATTAGTGANLLGAAVDGLTYSLGTAGNYAVGDKYAFVTYPDGNIYQPLSTGFESNTHYLYYGKFEDGTNSLLHKMTGARGTFRVEAQAGNYALFTFTFTGDYVDPTDDTEDVESGVTYETTIPTQVELAGVVASTTGTAPTDVLSEFGLCAQSFVVDMGNEVVARECINGQESYEGGIITSRNPTAGFNPETVLEADHPFWSALGDGDRVFWHAGVGSVAGNIVTFTAPYSQYANLAYANRNNLRAYDVNMRLAADGSEGNDELRIFFG